jgi:hypothetical protein
MNQDLMEIIEKHILHLNPFLDEGNLNWRADGRLEVICPHGIGHTVWSPRGKDVDFIHGCCGECCKHLSTLRTIVDEKGIKIKNE